MTLAELREIVVLNIGNRTDKDTLINSALNLALKEVQQVNRFRGMIVNSSLTINNGDLSVTMPAGTAEVLEAELINGPQSLPFAIRTKEWIKKRWPNNDPAVIPTGVPNVGYLEAGILYLIPSSNDTYTLNVTATTYLQMATDVDSPGIDFIDNALIAWATGSVFRSLQQFADAREWMSEYGRALQTAINADRRMGGLTVKSDEFVRAAKLENQQIITNPYDPFQGRNMR